MSDLETRLRIRAKAEGREDIAALTDDIERLAAEQQRLSGANPALKTLGSNAEQATAALGRIGIRSSAEIQADINQINQDLVRLAGNADVSAVEFDRAFAQAQRRLDGLQNELAGVSNEAARLPPALKPVAAAVAGLFAAGQVKQYVVELARVADLYQNLQSRVDLVNGTVAGFNVSLRDMAGLAQRTHSELEGTVNLFAALSRAGEELGSSQEDVLRLTETISKANQVAGQSAQAADAAIVQLIQGLQSGVLRGEEFNSIMEQSPRLARALADGLGVTVGALRRMANDGELTSDVVIRALQSQAAVIDEEFSRLPLTIGRSLTDLRTAWTEFVGGLDDGAGASGAVAKGIELLANNLDVAAAVTATAGVASAGAFARALIGLQAVISNTIKAHAAHATAAGANAAATTAAARQIGIAAGLIQKAGTLAASGWVGWEIGTALKEEFLEVELAGIALAAGLHKAAVRAKGAAEILKAPFTEDTMEAAFDRMQQKVQEVEAGYAALADEAIAARAKMGTAAKGAQSDVEQAADGMQKALRKLVADGAVDELVGKLKELSPAELTDFGRDAEAAFNRGALSAKELRTALDAQMREALRRLGVDANQALTGMSSQFTESAGALQILVGQVDRLKASGVETGALLSKAFGAALGTATTAREFEHLTRLVDDLAKNGQLAGPALDGMLKAVQERARGVNAEVRQINAEIAELQRQATNIRNGLAGAGARAQARRDRGLTDEERDSTNASRARNAIDEASRYATWAQNAALDGRAEKAQAYARQAAELIERAAAAADAIGDDDTAVRLLDQVAEAEARALEAQATAKKSQAAEIEQKSAEQAKGLAELEAKLQKIAEGATVTVKPDTSAAEKALAAVQAAVDAIPTEKTITVRTVHVTEGAPAGAGGTLESELLREARRSGSRE